MAIKLTGGPSGRGRWLLVAAVVVLGVYLVRVRRGTTGKAV